MGSGPDLGLERLTAGFVRLLAWCAGLVLVAALVPVGEALWSEVLGVSGSVQIAEWTPTPTPTPATGHGCTPGYWKQEQHFSSWPEPYFPQSDLAQAFGVDPLEGDPTLLDGLEAKGGGLDALLRHAVAALLNAASDGVNYPFDLETVVKMFQTALQSGDYETTKDALEAANESDCPLPLVQEDSVDLSTGEEPTAMPTAAPPSDEVPASQESESASLQASDGMTTPETPTASIEPPPDPGQSDELTSTTEP